MYVYHSANCPVVFIPQTRLPIEFKEWEEVGRSLPVLERCKAVRVAVEMMSELDASSLTSHEDQAYALGILSFTAACYVWEGVWDGEDKPPAKVDACYMWEGCGRGGQTARKGGCGTCGRGCGRGRIDCFREN